MGKAQLGSSLLTMVLVFLPILDTLTGLGLTEVGGGKVFRAGLLVASFMFFIALARKYIFAAEVLCAAGFATSASLTLILSGPQPGNVAFTLKILYIPTVYLTVVWLLDRGWLDETKVLKALWLSALVILGLSYSLYLLGLGEGLYTSTGFKGAFVAGNELVVSLTVLYPIVLYFALERRGLHWLLVPATSGLMVVLGSKASIGAAFVETLLVPWLWARFRRQGVLRSVLAPVLLFVAASLVAFLLLGPLLRSILVDRLRAAGGPGTGLLNLLLSHRNAVLARAFDQFVSEVTIANLLFGRGLAGAVALGAPVPGLPKLVEMDPVDMLFSHGLVGGFFLGGFWFLALTRIYQAWRERPAAPQVVAMAMVPVLVVQSLLAGHVVYSTIAGTALATTLALGGRPASPVGE